MGYPLIVALRYLASKRRNMISISTLLAIGGVTLGVAALTIVMSVTGGFQEQFREKVLGVNAHVLVLKYSIDFREYRDVMDKVKRNLSDRAQAELMEEIEVMGPVRMSQVDNAQSTIVRAVRELEASGEIVIARQTD